MKNHETLVCALFASLLLVGCGNSGSSPASTEASVATDAAVSPAATDDSPSLTRVQKNAVRSAKQYLQIAGFSREGLINQLSSDAGDGYNRSDAEAAVDSLDVDWNEQAKRSAEQYLNLTGFSCKGLVEQLSSGAGDKYTKEQARYGAQAAGAC